MTRIVQLANFVAPRSGGIRTTLDALADGYARAGHDVVRVVPGARLHVTPARWGTLVQLPGRPLPGTGYRLLTDLPRVRSHLQELAPGRVEVHDRATLAGIGPWARQRGVPALVVSHERLDRWLRQWLPDRLPLDAMADRANLRLASGFDRVVCTTRWAEEEFCRAGVDVLHRVPLGVDLELFSPQPDEPASPDLLLVLAGRLSREKRPQDAVGTLAELLRRGHRARLLVAGDGPSRTSLERRARGLPVTFLGFLRDRGRLAALLRRADVVLAPGPVESFGLAALEALACGTPVVASARSALPEVLGPAGGWGQTPSGAADAVERLLAVAPPARRAAARRRAELFPWSATVSGFLAAHGLAPARVGA